MPRRKPQHQILVTGVQRSRVQPATVRRWTRRAAAELKLPAGILSVVFVTAAVSQDWNTRYRRKHKPTNILSFRYDPPVDGVIGELILCPVIVRREALRGQYQARLKFLIEHGCIHLLGLDHQTSREMKQWEKIEQQLSA